MVDANVLKQIFSVPNAAWASFALLFLLVVRTWNGAPAMLEAWIHWQQAKAAERAADLGHFREEINRLSESERQCRRDYRELHSQHMNVVERLKALEGYMAGQGRASQEAAGVIALERVRKNSEIEKDTRDG